MSNPTTREDEQASPVTRRWHRALYAVVVTLLLLFGDCLTRWVGFVPPGAAHRHVHLMIMLLPARLVVFYAVGPPWSRGERAARRTLVGEVAVIALFAVTAAAYARLAGPIR